MKVALPKVIYYGEDVEYLNELKLHVKKYHDQEIIVEKHCYHRSTLSSLLMSQTILITFVDFTYPKLDANKVRSEIRQLKRTSQFKSILFVGLYATARECKENTMAFLEGFSFLQVKGEDEQLIITEVFNLAVSNEYARQAFSQAKNLNADCLISSLACVDKISPDKLCIEADYNLDLCSENQEFSLKTSLFEYAGEKKYKVTQKLKAACFYPLFHYYSLEFPYPGPWEEDDDDFLQKDSVETWLDLNSDILVKNLKVVIYSHIHALIFDQLQYQSEAIKCYTFDYINEEDDIRDTMEALSPSVIFYEFDDVVFTYEVYQKLTLEVRKNNDQCVIVALNTPSTSAAMQKMFSYNLMMATSSPLDIELYRNLIQRLSKSKRIETENYEFEEGDTQKLITIESKVKLVSLSEHEFTFRSEIHFPLFTVMSLELPVESFITIIEERLVKDNFEYKAVIHGIDSIQRESLRRIINQFIYKPPMEIDRKTIDSIISHQAHKKPEKEAMKPIVEDIVIYNEEPGAASQKENTSFPKRPIYSKL